MYTSCGVADVGVSTHEPERQQRPPCPPRLLRTSRAQFSIVGTYDGMHLTGWLNLAVFNLLLNELWETIEPGCQAGRRRRRVVASPE